MHFYTSISNNYLPKARVLAKSVKQFCPGSKFSLVLCDQLLSSIRIEEEPFDEILLVEDLEIPVDNLDLWIFQHSVVELCTAIKGQALVHFLETGASKVIYLDPDVVVFHELTEIETILDQNDVILTPHQTVPEKNKQDVMNNEICSLKHGTYNFGFYGVKNGVNGKRFAYWWRDRLIDFCYDDIPNGLFTDQKWGDLVPALFEGVYILREPGYNVSTWNLTSRTVIDENGNYKVNGKPLYFYHFSGFDSGAQKTMLDLYSHGNKVLYELRNWYIKQMEQNGQAEFGRLESKYNFYSSGLPVEKKARLLLRSRMDLIEAFRKIDPYEDNGVESYHQWYVDDQKAFSESAELSEKEQILHLQNELYQIYNSRSWKIVLLLRKVKNKLLRRK